MYLILSIKSPVSIALAFAMLSVISCKNHDAPHNQPVHKDIAFLQDYSKKYSVTDSVKLYKVCSDRNGVVQVLTSSGLYRPHGGNLLYPGTLVRDVSYRPVTDKNVSALTSYKNHFVYLDDKAIFSNAWAGSLYARHGLPEATLLAGGDDFDFLIAAGRNVQYVRDSVIVWKGDAGEPIKDIVFDDARNLFWLLGSTTIFTFSWKDSALQPVYSGTALRCFTLAANKKQVVVGTANGYLRLDAAAKQQVGELQVKLPWPALTVVKEIDGNLWFGSARGAFMLRADGKYSYYASQRWLPSDEVADIAKGPGNSVLVLTDKGLGHIFFDSMTLHRKAMFFEQQVRTRHIRHGFNASIGDMKDGNVDTGILEDSDNDGLWTSMYLGAEVFRYAVTKSEDALQNCRESMEAMERLYSINGVTGFPSRSFERRGYKYQDEPWRRASHPEWDWKSTTSSDEAIGHMFVFGVMAELIEDDDLRRRAIVLMDSLMQHIVDNNLYLVDWNGQPTLWGKWNPEYVNARPAMVGDRKINASNIIAMLQTAYRFTKKEVYRQKAFELMTRHGYYDNLLRPMKEIGMAPADADQWSRMLSEAWNHSDDEMYFLGYWGLYRYAFNDTLKAGFREAIIDHWQVERPEKDGAWNIVTAMTGTADFDLEDAIWYLQEYPLDLVGWTVRNSERKDITLMEKNFRGQATSEVLPPDELPIRRHNANRFQLDGGDNGTSEHSAGDIWLLPYWMGRYLGVIEEER